MVVAGAADEIVGAATAVKLVIAGIAHQVVADAVSKQHVVADAAVGILDHGAEGNRQVIAAVIKRVSEQGQFGVRFSPLRALQLHPVQRPMPCFLKAHLPDRAESSRTEVDAGGMAEGGGVENIMAAGIPDDPLKRRAAG